MTKKNKIKFGVVGVGFLGQHHARIYSTLEEAEFVGVYDVNTERAEQIAKEYNCQRFESLEAIAEACDAISVVVPTDKHYEVTKPLLNAGCHLLIEKPLCTNLKEASAILDLAKEKNRIIQVGHIEHYNPVMSYLEEIVDDPKYITADRFAPFNPRGTEVGVVLDLMIHDIGVLLQLVKSPIKDIQAVGVNILMNSEDIANARITFENGAVANLNASRVSSKKTREIRLFQSDLYLSLDFMNQTGHLMRKSGFSIQKEDVPLTKGEPLMIELKEFARCIQESDQPKVGAALGRDALEVALAITAKIKESQAQFAAC